MRERKKEHENWGGSSCEFFPNYKTIINFRFVFSVSFAFFSLHQFLQFLIYFFGSRNVLEISTARASRVQPNISNSKILHFSYEKSESKWGKKTGSEVESFVGHFSNFELEIELYMTIVMVFELETITQTRSDNNRSLLFIQQTTDCAQTTQ